MKKPKVGILFFAHEWFWNAKMFGPEFLASLKRDASNIEKSLKSFAETVGSELILNENQACDAARKLLAEHVNLTIFFPIVWSADKPMVAALREIEKKSLLLLWCHNPYERLPESMNFEEVIRGSGLIGALQMASAMKRLGISYIPVFGKLDEALGIINEYSIAAKVVEDLKRTKLGLLPWRYDEMVGTWVDEAKLLGKVGPRIEHISVAELHEAAGSLDEREVDSFVEYLRKNYEITDVSEKSLHVSAKASLALAKIVEEHNLDGIVMQDLDEEMHRVLRTRPGIYTESMSQRGVAVGMESDVSATLSMIILQKLSGKPAMFGEIFNYDMEENTLVIAHVGVLNINLAKDLSKVRIIPDCEYKSYDEVEGAYTYFTCKEGFVTLLSIVNEGDTYRLIISKGESIATNEKLEGYSHMLVRLDAPLKRFFETALKSGTNQHWAVVHDDVVSKLEKLAELLEFERTTIT